MNNKRTFPHRKTKRPLSQSLPSVELGNRNIEINYAAIRGDFSPGNESLSGELYDFAIEIHSHINISNLNIEFSVHRNDCVLVIGPSSRLLGYTISICAVRQLAITFRLRLDISSGLYLHAPFCSLRLGSSLNAHHCKENVCEFYVSGIIGAHFQGHSRLFPLFFAERNSNEKDGGIVIECFDPGPYLTKHHLCLGEIPVDLLSCSGKCCMVRK